MEKRRREENKSKSISRRIYLHQELTRLSHQPSDTPATVVKGCELLNFKIDNYETTKKQSDLYNDFEGIETVVCCL